ncbi:MAG: VOC family protein [Pseudomonadota bacterium]
MSEPTGKATVFLGFNGDAEDAVRHYARTFPMCEIGEVQRGPSADGEGQVFIISFTMAGIPCVALNVGPHFEHSEAFSFQITTDTQEETDHYWDALTGNGGEESRCGWCKDRWGVSWQITPRKLTEGMADPDREAAGRVMQAMMAMNKIDIAAIESARRG